ncbi:MAG: LysE family translocator [Arenicellales bacterium WSBS_2016_MAG_OTU3]
MSFEIFTALILFSFVSSITPGPNNLMLLTSGVNFGFRPTIPHMLGISAGFAVLLACIGLGLGQLFASVPEAFWALKFAGGIYLLYLAYKIATSGLIERGEAGGKPFTFLQAAAFQWVNPKAWVMAVTAMTIYTQSGDYWLGVAIVVVVFASINLPCISFWCSFGTAMKEFLAAPKKLHIFNFIMALLLVVSIWPIVGVQV